jgi:nitrite reductase (NO-forming)
MATENSTLGEGALPMNRRVAALLGAMLGTLCFGAAAMPEELDLPREQVALVAPPFVHPHEQATNQGPKIVEFTLTVEEKRIVIDNEGTAIQAMTFNGSIPGPMMVVHEGDYVELTLINPSTNSLAHNMDFHAATGALGFVRH